MIFMDLKMKKYPLVENLISNLEEKFPEKLLLLYSCEKANIVSLNYFVALHKSTAEDFDVERYKHFTEKNIKYS